MTGFFEEIILAGGRGQNLTLAFLRIFCQVQVLLERELSMVIQDMGVCAKSLQLCPILCSPMYLAGSSDFFK